ncbi:hypothetical protein HRbin12_00535 [bacterium HR12]|nr:hypothetical protein HRbin12_00535 [bacterium HR12]
MTGGASLAAIRLLAADPARGGATTTVPGDPEEAPTLLAGAVDLVVEAASPSADELREALRALIGAESAFRFELYERATRAEALERAARMREREIAMTEGWLVPRLEREIVRYEARLEALERALGEER